jgi:glycosyltransferase involved in cell wall biosynthesis
MTQMSFDSYAVEPVLKPHLSRKHLMHDALSTGQPRTVWLDITTSWHARRGTMNGTMRVEQSYLRELQEIMPGTLRLCRYHASRRRFVSVATPPVGKAGDAPRKAGTRGGTALRLGRSIERSFRTLRRSAAAVAHAAFDAARGEKASPFAEARPGDMMLLTGEKWSRFDFSVLRLARRSGLRIAAICQDMIPIKCPQFYADDGFVARFANYANFLIEDVDLIIAISEKTKIDILDYAHSRGGVRGDIKTVFLGHDVGVPVSSTRPPSLSGLEPRRFVLSVSSIQSRKNFNLIYHVWQRLATEGLPNLPKLVIAGRPGFGSSDLMWQIARDPAVRDCMMVRHDVSDVALAWLYRECAFTLYPSFYEGWGLPVSESLAHGKFCIASTAPALVEAGRGLARHIDPLDFVAWKDAIVELVRSPEKLTEHERRIKANYRGVTWRESALNLAALLQHAD